MLFSGDRSRIDIPLQATLPAMCNEGHRSIWDLACGYQHSAWALAGRVGLPAGSAVFQLGPFALAHVAAPASYALDDPQGPRPQDCHYPWHEHDAVGGGVLDRLVCHARLIVLSRHRCGPTLSGNRLVRERYKTREACPRSIAEPDAAETLWQLASPAP